MSDKLSKSEKIAAAKKKVNETFNLKSSKIMCCNEGKNL